MEASRNHVVVCPACGAEHAGIDFILVPEENTVATVHGQARMTPQEFAFARLLIERAPAMVSKSHAYETVFLDESGNGPEIKILDIVICRIRKSLATIGLEVRTEWGKGWRITWLGHDGPTDPSEVMRGPRGPQPRWTSALDSQLSELVGRGYKAPQIAAIMKKPYGAVERAIRRLASEGV